MDALLIVINVLLILNALVLIVSVLMQDGARSGLGAISGGAETFFGKSKAKSYEGKLQMITKVSVSSFIVLAMLMTAINARRGISNLSSVDLSNAPSVSDLLEEKKKVTGDGLDTTLPEETPAPEGTPEEKALTETPAETEAPAAAEETSAATEAPAAAEETPAATEAPAATETPAATEAPVGTEAPAETPAP